MVCPSTVQSVLLHARSAANGHVPAPAWSRRTPSQLKLAARCTSRPLRARRWPGEEGRRAPCRTRPGRPRAAAGSQPGRPGRPRRRHRPRRRSRCQCPPARPAARARRRTATPPPAWPAAAACAARAARQRPRAPAPATAPATRPVSPARPQRGRSARREAARPAPGRAACCDARLQALALLWSRAYTSGARAGPCGLVQAAASSAAAGARAESQAASAQDASQAACGLPWRQRQPRVHSRLPACAPPEQGKAPACAHRRRRRGVARREHIVKLQLAAASVVCSGLPRAAPALAGAPLLAPLPDSLRDHRHLEAGERLRAQLRAGRRADVRARLRRRNGQPAGHPLWRKRVELSVRHRAAPRPCRPRKRAGDAAAGVGLQP